MSQAKTREMVTEPTAFENFRRLMRGLLAVPKEEIGKSRATRKRKARRTG
jgi:hypothetical protein